MEVLRTPAEMQQWSKEVTGTGNSIGFVPTMGALHNGHARLLNESLDRDDVSVLSVFVNPTQFNNSDDFRLYPRTDDQDLALAKEMGVSCVYLPSVDVMYPEGSSVVVEPGTAAEPMEGVMRPGHFRGVTTVVTKLFNAVLPSRAYFGKKDYQQLAVIRQMVEDLDFPVEIVGVDTVREGDGLALSSRNVRLSEVARKDAPIIFTSLRWALNEHSRGNHDAHDLSIGIQSRLQQSQLCRPEYVEVVDTQTLCSVSDTRDGAVICIAAWFDDVRLIDNIELPVSS